MLVLLGAMVLGCLWSLVSGTPPWARAPLEENATRKTALDFHLANGLWQAAAFSLAIIAGLLATARWWMVRGAAGLAFGARSPVGRFWIWLGPVLLLALLTRVPLLDHSVYGDEHYSITRFILGEPRLAKNGETEFRELEWQQTIWGYQRPNNHIFFSIIARAGHTAWAKITGAEDGRIQVSVLRAPSLIAALLSIGLAAWMLWTHGFRIGAVAAALLMALHPWHIAHSVEVRGYAFVFLFLTGTVWFALAALKTGHWSAWSALAAVQFCLLHTYPKAVLIAAPTSLVVLIALAREARREPALARRLFGPFFATQSLLVVALAFAYFPCVPQLGEYFATVAPKGTMCAGWLMDVVSLFLVGRYWREWEPSNLLCRSLANEADAWPWLVLPLLALLAWFGLRGAWILVRKQSWMALLLAPMVVSIPLALLHARHTEAYVFTWHMIMPLPLWLICLGVGLESSRLPSARPALAWLPMAVALLAFLHFSSPQRNVIARYPAEPVGETFASLTQHRAVFEGTHPSVYAMASLVDFHDPAIRKLRCEKALGETISKYRATGSPFFLVLPGIHSIRETSPDLARLLEQSGQFRLLARHHGLEFAHRSYDLWLFGEN